MLDDETWRHKAARFFPGRVTATAGSLAQSVTKARHCTDEISEKIYLRVYHPPKNEPAPYSERVVELWRDRQKIRSQRYFLKLKKCLRPLCFVFGFPPDRVPNFRKPGAESTFQHRPKRTPLFPLFLEQNQRRAASGHELQLGDVAFRRRSKHPRILAAKLRCAFVTYLIGRAGNARRVRHHQPTRLKKTKLLLILKRRH